MIFGPPPSMPVPLLAAPLLPYVALPFLSLHRPSLLLPSPCCSLALSLFLFLFFTLSVLDRRRVIIIGKVACRCSESKLIADGCARCGLGPVCSCFPPSRSFCLVRLSCCSSLTPADVEPSRPPLPSPLSILSLLSECSTRPAPRHTLAPNSSRSAPELALLVGSFSRACMPILRSTRLSPSPAAAAAAAAVAVSPLATAPAVLLSPSSVSEPLISCQGK